MIGTDSHLTEMRLIAKGNGGGVCETFSMAKNQSYILTNGSERSFCKSTFGVGMECWHACGRWSRSLACLCRNTTDECSKELGMFHINGELLMMFLTSIRRFWHVFFLFFAQSWLRHPSSWV